jgi:hypothetical protein
MDDDTIYSWESLPEYVATQEYSRCLGRILASLPPLLARRATNPLTLAAIWLGAGIAAVNADLPPGEELPPDERARFRARSLDGLRTSRRRLRRLHRWRLGDRQEIRRALDLLDQVEQWMNAPRAAGTMTH